MPHTTIPSRDIASVYRGKTILITGSVGTVGSEVLKQVLQFEPAEVRIFDNHETGLFHQMNAHGNGSKPLIPD